jgi:transcriptional regulator with XRE-family HTH domain
MAARKRATTAKKKRSKATAKQRASKRAQASGREPRAPAPGLVSDLQELEGSFMRLFADLTGEITSGALRLAARSGGVPLQVARALLPGAGRLNPLDPERLEMMRDTGRYLKDLRELAGLTVSELSAALNLKDRTVLEAAENGTATISFELILRLAALLARHDPIPFVIRFTRTYNPEIWRILEDWGIGRLPLQYEREREFINIFRGRDTARRLSDRGFALVLEFTRAGFDMALHFAAAQEGISERQKAGRRRAERNPASELDRPD